MFPFLNVYRVYVFPDNVSFFLKNNKHLSVTKDAWEILKYCDGGNSFNRIQEIVNVDYEISIDDLTEFLKKAKELSIIEYNSIPKKEEIMVFGDGKRIVPLALSLELTNKCNLECNYCYGGFKKTGRKFWKTEDLKVLFDDFAKIGCMILELTGGEPLLHPEFNEILLLSLKKFEVVNILTNGVLLNDQIIDIIAENKKRIGIQISIDGSTEETNYKVRGVKNTFEKTLQAIRQLRNKGIYYKIAYITTTDNIHEIPAICELFRKEKINNLLISKATGFGRACSQKDCLVSNENDDFAKIVNTMVKEYTDVINEVHYQDFFTLPVIDRNCGAGWKLFSISAEGNIGSCAILGKNGYIGNVLNQSIHKILELPICELYSNFSIQRNEESCIECSYYNYCGRCITRIYSANIQKIKDGLDLCEIAKRNKMDLFLNFNSDFAFLL